MALETELLKKTKDFATDLIKTKSPEFMFYHNLDHTMEVVVAAEELAEKNDLDEDQKEIVLIAAWMHDVGYTASQEEHEEKSIEISNNFLSGINVDPIKIAEVAKCIKATRMPQRPLDLLDSVLCDADLYNLSTDKFEKNTKVLLKELNARGENMTDEEWSTKNLEFLQSHEYYTEYAKEYLEPGKLKNLKKLRKEEKNSKGADKYLSKLEDENRKLRIKSRTVKDKKPERGIETMFRLTSKNHLALSAMADNKANIMITVNTLVLSVLGSVMVRKIDDYPNLMIPTLILVLTCLAAMVFSVLATRPNVTSGRFTQDDVIKKKTNLLFFGNFHGMGLNDYLWGMQELMKDGDYLYSSLIKDIYFLGIVLGKKYKYLRYSYNVFMYGIIISVLTFIIAAYFFSPESIVIGPEEIDDSAF